MNKNSNLFNYYCLSDYDLDGNFRYDSNTNRFVLKSIYSIFIHAPKNDVSEGNLFLSLPEIREINVRAYDNGKFYVTQIGKTKRLWFPNQMAYDMVNDAFDKSNGILAYWDARSIAFVVENEELLEVVNEFLKSVPYIGYFKEKNGVLLVK